MLWLNFLHLYQPANTEFYNIRKALDKSYWRLIRLLEEHPDLKMTFNVSGCLLERLEEAGEKDFLERLKFLVKKGRVELVGSAYYHGLLPLLPEKEVIYQIKAQEKILKKFFGKNFKPQGFFLPEMAYSVSVAKLVKRLGYEWLILDEISYSGPTKSRPSVNERYLDEASGLRVVFRSRDFSNSYPPDRLLTLKNNSSESLAKLVFFSATDAELYGLRHEDPTGEMERAVKMKNLTTMTVSQFLKGLGKKGIIKVKVWPSSWEATTGEIKAGRFYALWEDKNNKIQANLWKLAILALSLGEKYKKDKNYYWYRWHLSRGLASCAFWWASARNFAKTFGPYAWSPDDIERGLGDLVRSIRSLNDLKTKKQKLEAEKYYLKIKKLIWEEHWKKHWQKTI